LIPASKVPGSRAFVLTVSGTGFAHDAILQWNGSSRPTTFVSQAELQAKILASDIATAGTASVTVLNPGVGVSNVVYLPIRRPSTTFKGTQDRSFHPKAKELAVGDFNHDGKLDVVTANSTTQVVTSLGNGDGTFAAPITTLTTWRIFNLAAADFNEDGNLDLLAAVNKYQVAIFYGNGDGTFTQGPLSPYAGLGTSFAIADLNGDGKLDFVEGQPDELSGATMFVYLNNGADTFAAAWEYSPAGATFTTLSAIGDFNGDAVLDFANSGYAFLGTGSGTFTSNSFCCIDMIDSAATADLNGDGILDVVTDRGAVSLGLGDGGFDQISDLRFFGFNVALGDVNGDGKLDMVIRDEDLNNQMHLEILLGNGDGTFQSAITFNLPPSNGEQQFDQMRLGDFNGDGRLDVIVGANPTFLLLQK
jgi:hypothetical protein